jgi:DNA-binding NarL/FixJ family response regulator
MNTHQGQQVTSLRAFIVEDNKTVRDSLIATLRELAWVESVGQAESESEGARWLHENAARWDLAIVDLFLKEGTGLRVLEACRDRLPTQKMVVVSNYATQDVRWRCTQLGADAVFDKTTEIDDLIDYCLRRREEGHRLVQPS